MQIPLRITLVVLVSLLCSAHAGTAQTLWQQAEYGMTAAEVSIAFPGSIVLPTQRQQHLANGATELVRAPIVEVVGNQFEPSFFFLSDMLIQVTLTLRGVNDSREALAVFQSLTTALRVRYGPEVASSRTAIRSGVDWQSGMTNISTILFTIGPTDPLLNINYQMRIAADAGKL